jgi:hypothetical protein
MILYQKTINIEGLTDDQIAKLKPGQWVRLYGDITGQYLGITARGTVTINYKQTKDLRKQYAANQPLRRFVLLHGGK